MESEAKFTVHEKATKKQKGKPVSFFRTIKTDGTKAAADKAVNCLKKKLTPQFEVRNAGSGGKTVYKKLINSSNYEVKGC